MIGTAAAFQRFGLGPRPGDLAAVYDFREAIQSEVGTAAIALLSGSDLPTSGDALAELARERVAEARPEVAAQARFYRAETASRLARFREAEIGFVERLVTFWTNHFSVEIGAGTLERSLVGAFEREAIRPNVLGNFRDMLGAVTKHPAMLSYLDNAQSVGPNSSVGLRRRVGLNENDARELLELHTIGVDGGYDQADVTALARIMTGWTFARNSNQRVPIGSFLFAGAAHEPGVQTVLGVHYPAGGVQQGEAVLDMLTVHPETGRHIAFKLVRHFVADDPPEDLVAELATTFVDGGGDLKAVALALIGSDTAFAEATKIKTPQEFLWSSLRALELDIGPQLVLRGLRTLGQPMWDPPSPEGFSDESATWLAPDAMTDRLDIADILVERANIGYLPG